MYDNEKMLGLADSIKEQGVVIPILVRPIKNNKYEYGDYVFYVVRGS